MNIKNLIGQSANSLLAITLVSLIATAAFASATTDSDLPEQVTYSEHVAAVFNTNCITCHRPNDVAPMSLLDYSSTRPWAKSIQRAVVARDMPPWDASPEHGVFSNDISLSDREVALISKWVEQGAKQGDPALTPKTPELAAAGSWKMGREPDYVIDLAAIDVKEGGPDVFVTQVFGAAIPEGKWIQALELLPGNTDVLHHVVTYLGPFGIGDESEEEAASTGLTRTIFLNDAARRQIRMTEAPRIGGVWVAGSPPTVFENGIGHTADADQMFSFNMHYHPSGTAGTDQSKLGVYFGEGDIEKVITTAFAADMGLHIAAGDPDHREDAVYLFANDSKILSLLPHMHNRGKSMKYTLQRPDGSQEVLLDVPAYDYDWQNIYRLAEPVDAPAGSFVQVEAHWDNSPENPANPNPTAEVPWGDGTNNEMLVAFIDFIDADRLKPRAPRVNKQIERLLTKHSADSSYMVAMDGMGFAGKWGLVLPDASSDTGEFYMLIDQLVITNTIRNPIKVGDELILNATMIAGAGGASMPMAMVVTTNDKGELTGELHFNRKLEAKDLDQVRGKGRGLTGLSIAAKATEEQSSAGR